MKKLLVIISLGILFILEFSLIAGEWNEKPVMCASEEETFQSLKAKGEKIFFMGNGFTKVRTETGLAHKPVTLPFRIYGNLETGTFTIIELHPDYNTYCVIAYGVNFQDYREML
tara:strand:+ start:243 stop:584 length:342 start_codon:yes stop_codon:yes gene_type:complete